MVSRRAAEISPEKIQWLWPSRLARGKHTCIAGEPGTGKSQLSIAMIAIVTTGGEWPCAEGWAPIGSVIILSAEDGAALIPYGFNEFLGRSPEMERDDGTAVITDDTHRNETSAAGAVEVFAEPIVGQFGLLIAMGPDEPIKKLPQSEQQMINIFGQDEIDLGEQLFGRCPRSPWCESTNTRAAAFGTSKKEMVGHKTEPLREEKSGAALAAGFLSLSMDGEAGRNHIDGGTYSPLEAVNIPPRRLFDQATSFVSVMKPSRTYSLVGIRRMSSVT